MGLAYIGALQQSITDSEVQFVVDSAFDKRNDVYCLEDVEHRACSVS